MRLILRGADWWAISAKTAAPASDDGPDEPLREVIRLGRAGRAAEAEQHCREVLDREPASADGTHALGLLLLDARSFDEGFDLLCRSVEMSPSTARFHNNLGSALGKVGLHRDAADAFRRAMRLRPDFAAAQGNLTAASAKIQGAAP